jgi:hypothetical protein
MDKINYVYDHSILTTPSKKSWRVMTIRDESVVLDDRRQFTRICWWQATQVSITEKQEKL